MALTSVASKSLEKLVPQHINSVVPDTVDPLQFACCSNTSVDDGVALAPHSAAPGHSHTHSYGSWITDPSFPHRQARGGEDGKDGLC